MGFVTVGKENSTNVDLYYEDHGAGQPVVLIHGYPLNGHSWERQDRALLDAGYRVIAYDRRGFGPLQPAHRRLRLRHLRRRPERAARAPRPRDIVLVGFSMGTGEVTRYLGNYGSARVSKAALLGAIPPFLLKTDDNPEGVDGQVFEGIKAADRRRTATPTSRTFLDDFYNVDKLGARADQRAGLAGQLQRRGRRLAVRDLRLRRHLADRLPRRPAEDRRPDAGRPRHRGPDPAVRGDRGAAAGLIDDVGSSRSTGPAQHRLDPPRGGQPAAAGVRRGRPGRGRRGSFAGRQGLTLGYPNVNT